MSAHVKNIVVGLVDDDDLFREYLKGMLEREGYKVLDAADGESFFEILNRRDLDCILLDFNLGSETGFQVYDKIKNSQTGAPPVVMLTANEQQPVAIRAFREGVVDFIAKRGLRIDTLMATIEKAVEQRGEEELRDEQMTLLKSQYALDLATGLFARHEVEKRIAQMAKSAERRGSGFAMILGFIAGVQEISDRFGYVQGDRALRTAASRFREAIRPCDQGGRADDAVFVCLVDSDTSDATLRGIEDNIAKALAFEFRVQAASFSLVGQTRVVRLPHENEAPLALLESAIAKFEIPIVAPVVAAEVFSDAGVQNETMDRAEALSNSGSQGETERRKSRRHRVFKGAGIVLGPSIIDCTVRDMSESGARLRIPESFAVPSRFELRMKDTGESRKVAVRWQVGVDLGVEYLA